MHPLHRLQKFLLLLPALPASALAASMTLSADDQSEIPDDPEPTYTIIRQVLGRSGFNTPDCTHPGFGPHITRAADPVMGQVFVFHLHVTPDGDMCLSTNHPRNEIKVDAQSPEYLKAYHQDRVSYRWLFRIPEGFQSSYNFTYIHQIKAVDGDTLKPLIAFNLQKGKSGQPDNFVVTHADSAGERRTLASTPLTPFFGEWVEAHERVTADTRGRYALTLTRMRDGQVLLDYASNDIDMWRFYGTTFIRPKWGLYRSVDNPQYLRDDAVSYKSFCLAKGDDVCPASNQLAAPEFSPVPGNYTGAQQVSLSSAAPGATLRYTLDGNAPGCSSGTLYSAPVTLSATTTLRAIACHSDWLPSPVATGSYTIGSAPMRLPVAASAVTASASYGSNLPAATVDGSLRTGWAAQGDGQWLRYDLGAVRTVNRLDIAWYMGDRGRMNFELQTSLDGSSFTTVHAGESSGTTTELETYAFPGASARYVRILGHGNSSNSWNLVTETEIWGQP